MSSAAAAAARRAGSPAPTCRASPARCGWRTTRASASTPASRRRRARSPSSVDALERFAVDAGDAVVPRQRAVHERELAVDEVEDAAVLADDRARRTAASRAASRRAARRRQSGTCAASGFLRSMQRGGSATAPRSSPPARRPSDLAASAVTCASSTAGSRSRLPSRQLEQLVVRHAAPQEIRQPRGQLVIAQAIRACTAAAGRARCGTGNSATPEWPANPRGCPPRTDRLASVPARPASIAAAISCSVGGRR